MISVGMPALILHLGTKIEVSWLQQFTPLMDRFKC